MNKVKKATLAIGALALAAVLSGVRTTSVSAKASGTGIRQLITISSNDATPGETLKSRLISDRLTLDPSLSVDCIDTAGSRIDLSGLNRNQAGLQTVSAKIRLCASKNSTSEKDISAAYTFIENVTVKVVKETAPQIRLKAERITVNNGDVWNPFSALSYVNDDSGILPAVIVDGKVDMNTDGNYPVTYTAVDLQGNRTKTQLTVEVRTPEEVIRAREEAERIAREKAEAEEAARLEAERIAQEEAERQRQEQLAAIMASYSNASGSATGSAIAQAARAWAGVGYYAWGGADPAYGADCSGFTQYIYAQFGISLAHNNLAQAAAGYQVSAAEALPGDLVVWDNHVGIYTGGGYYVSAMSYELGILEIPISVSRGSGSYWGIYRIPGVN